MNVKMKLRGEYKLAIQRNDGTIEETPWFHNTILNQGLDRIGSGGNTDYIVSYAQVGAGTTPPSVTQTSLESYVAGSAISTSASSVINSGSPTYATTQTFTLTFAQGAVVGTIAEVGVGWAATGSTLFSRELIRDGSGNPTTLSLTSIDQLIVFYKLTFTPVITDVTGTVNLGTQTVNYTSRLAFADNFVTLNNVFRPLRLVTASDTTGGVTAYPSGSTLGAITAGPSGSPISSSASYTISSYSTGNYYLDTTIFWGTTQGNGTGGLQALLFQLGTGNLGGGNGGTQYQVRFDSPILKDGTKTLSLTFRMSWARG